MVQGPAHRIMLVEDEAKIAAILQAELERYGYPVVQVRDFARVKEEFIRHQPHLVLLDIQLPRYDGYFWCRQIRTVSKVPIIFISARGADVDQVRALESGGDDYITKPFSLELVVAKVQSTIRRVYGEYALGGDNAEPKPFLVGDLVIDPATNRIRRGAASVELAPKEFQLLWRLVRRSGRVVSRDELLEALWDDVDFVDDNTLTVNVARLRRRLDELGLGDAIETKRGQGYLFNPGAGCDGPAGPVRP